MNQTPPSETESAPISQFDFRVFDLGKIALRVWGRRYFILGCAIGGAVLAYAVAFHLHPQFDATVQLMPPSHKDSSILDSLSPGRNDGDLYLGLITSRTVADDVIQSQHLAEYFHTTQPSQLRKNLAAIAKITVNRNQFISITVRAPEPETSVRIANEFPEALSRLNRAVALSQAAHRWEFFEGPLEQEKNKLADAEEQLKLAQQKTGMVLPEAQVQLGLSSIAQLKQEITNRREQLAALETGSTEQNPQVIQLRSQIASLSGQLERMQAQNGGAGTTASSAQFPQLTLDIERKSREVKFHETLFEVLSRQYENARVDDTYSPPVELVDKAVLPDEKSWPSRRLFAMYGLIAGGVFGLLYSWWRR